MCKILKVAYWFSCEVWFVIHFVIMEYLKITFCLFIRFQVVCLYKQKSNL